MFHTNLCYLFNINFQYIKLQRIIILCIYLDKKITILDQWNFTCTHIYI